MFFVALASLQVGMLPAESFAQESMEQPSWAQAQSIPGRYQGRWAQLDVNGSTRPDACYKPNRLTDDLLSGPQSADLVVGSTWLDFGGGPVMIFDIKDGAKDGIGYHVVSRENSEIAIDFNLMSISANGSQLEIASSPEIGWEVMRYSRCPADPVAAE